MSALEPHISIVLPTYNGARYIRQSIESCLSQTFSELELIVVDDGSVDQTSSIIQSFQDPRLRYLKFDCNQGHIAALNYGFAQSRGKFLTWTSDDNYYHPQALARMLEVFKKDDPVDFVYTQYSLIDENGTRLRAGRIRQPRELDEDNCVGGCFLYRRDVYEQVGDFHSEAFLAEDYEYWLRVRQHFKMRMIVDDLYFYRVHADSLTGLHKDEKVQEQVERIRERFIPEYKKYFFRARKFHSLGEVGQARMAINQSLKGNLFYLSSWRLWFLLHLNPAVIDKIRALKNRGTH